MQMPDMCDSAGPWVEMVFLKRAQREAIKAEAVWPFKATCFTPDPRRFRGMFIHVKQSARAASDVGFNAAAAAMKLNE